MSTLLALPEVVTLATAALERDGALTAAIARRYIK